MVSSLVVFCGLVWLALHLFFVSHLRNARDCVEALAVAYCLYFAATLTIASSLLGLDLLWSSRPKAVAAEPQKATVVSIVRSA